jgi:outer membrane protein TolC
LHRLLGSNPEIRLAAAEVDRQRARLDAASADLGPTLDATAGGSIRSADGARSEQLSAGLDARLPLDLFGQLAATRDARAWEYAQALALLEDARLAQAESLLLALTDYAEARQRETLLRQQIATTGQQLHLTQIRFTQGLVSSVDVLQQQQQIAALKQQLPDEERSARLAMNRASELLGGTPARDMDLPQDLPELPPAIPLSRPIELLQRRPDLLAQRAALAAADADFEAALRARLPTLELTGGALWQLASGNPSAIIQAALDASVNLFDSGAQSAEIQSRRAALRQAGLRYLQDWLTAVRETDDLLNTLATQDRQLRLTDERLRIADKLYRATLSRYQRGITDYLPVLTALQDLQQQQREALHLNAERQRTLIRLKTAAGLAPAAAEPNGASS